MANLSESAIDHNSSPGESEYLTFTLDSEEYGFPILSVIDIRGWEEPTRVPNCSPEMKGIINIRGAIVPIIDLREKFNMEPKPYTKLTVTIVVKVECEDGKERVIGFIVDAVSDVHKLSEDNLKPAPNETTINKKYISNIGVSNEKIIVLLKPNELSDDTQIAEES